MYAHASTTEISTQSSLISDIMGAGIAVQFLLLVLIGMSIVSWAIIFKKRKVFNLVREQNEKFLDLFWSAASLDQVKDKLERHGESPLSRIFNAGFSEMERVQRKKNHTLGDSIDNLERSLRKGQDQEVSLLEEKLAFLATTGSTAPFIGLLGTVVGIMNSFRAISNAGSASLATVAPGISEALFATAVGLFAAIPAVMAYNYMLNEVRKQENQMNNFISEFLNIARLQQQKD
jgi:biopolymer transport protein TolQ